MFHVSKVFQFVFDIDKRKACNIVQFRIHGTLNTFVTTMKYKQLYRKTDLLEEDKILSLGQTKFSELSTSQKRCSMLFELAQGLQNKKAIIS